MSTIEHPFAQYIRILGKGPHLSRHLTEDEAFAAARLVMRGEVEPIQLGAFLCLLRVRSETPEELAGLVRAARETLPLPTNAPAVDLDWPSYAGKKNRLPWFLLSALLLAGSGIRIFMHGAGEHTAGRVYTEPVLTALGFPPAQSLDEAAAQIRTQNFAFLPLTGLSPRLAWLMDLKSVIGVRSPIHTAVKALNPFDAPCQVIGVAHPPYRPLHQETARLLGQKRLAVFKGEGGEAERRAEKSCDVALLVDGTVSDEVWPALLTSPSLPHDEAIDPAQLRDVWNGRNQDATSAALITGTAAILLKLLGRANDQGAAQALAESLWANRDRARLDGAA